MSDKVISKDKIQDFLTALMAEQTVVAPMERKGAPADYRELKLGDAPILSGDQMMMTPRDYLLPQTELLAKIDTSKGQEKIESLIPERKPRVMMGMWFPDAQAIQVLDKVYLGSTYKDPYYAARRENLTLVATIPDAPRWSWFLTSLDDLENWKKNVDALMYDIGDAYYFEPVTERGEALLRSGAFNDPSEAETARKNEIWEKFKSTPPLPFAGKTLYDQLLWDSPVWAETARKCMACGICSYVCPSCSCFDIQDDTTCGDGCVERYRCRDGCQFKEFTQMGHGHNPRPDQLPRARQRLLHKFKYQHEQFEIVGCTGCGRCIELCPVNIDISEILTKVCSEDGAEKAAA